MSFADRADEPPSWGRGKSEADTPGFRRAGPSSCMKARVPRRAVEHTEIREAHGESSDRRAEGTETRRLCDLFVLRELRAPPGQSFSYPGQPRTGSGGNLRKAGSVFDRSQRVKRLPRSLMMTRAWRQV